MMKRMTTAATLLLAATCACARTQGTSKTEFTLGSIQDLSGRSRASVVSDYVKVSQ